MCGSTLTSGIVRIYNPPCILIPIERVFSGEGFSSMRVQHMPHTDYHSIAIIVTRGQPNYLNVRPFL